MEKAAEMGALRAWGLIASGAALAVATAIAVFDREPAVAQAPPLAHVGEPPLAFAVRFAPDHPLAHAQTLAAMGRTEDAKREVESILPLRRELSGLCFVRFAANADIIVQPCEEDERARTERLRALWSARFASMAGVSYAEAHMILRSDESQSNHGPGAPAQDRNR
ncbi:MAG TPA: hypothetical protein VG943_06325 [Caulobacterales bacterium]|nr:hypothetical protein [Caulobacterales bacterium]